MIRIHRDAIPRHRLPAYERAATITDGDYLVIPPHRYTALTSPPAARLRHRLSSLAAALRQWLRAGCPITPPHIRQARRTICPTCPHYLPAHGVVPARCAHCGCALRAKTLMATASCPLGHW